MKENKISKASSYLFCSTAVLTSLLFIDHKEVKADTISQTNKTTDSNIKQTPVAAPLNLNQQKNNVNSTDTAQTDSQIKQTDVSSNINTTQVDNNKAGTATNFNNTSTPVASSTQVKATTTDENIIESTWGTSPVSYDKTTNILTVGSGTIISLDGYGYDPYGKIPNINVYYVKKIIFNGNVRAPSNSTLLFSGSVFRNLISIEGSLDVSNVTNMWAMFNSSMVTNLDFISNWDTSNVTNMMSMFYFSRATSLNMINKWDTSNVTNMMNMFIGCDSLTNLDLSGWDISSVIVMDSMFAYCDSLTSLDLSGWDTSNIIYMNNLFYKSKIKRLVLGPKTLLYPSIDTDDNIEDDSGMPEISTDSNEYTGRWIKIINNSEYFPNITAQGNIESVYTNSDEFMNQYNGTYPGTYTWEKYGVITRYVDENGNEISSAPATIKTGKLAENYTTTPETITGYTLKTSPNNASGKYNSDVPTEVVTYIYTMNPLVGGNVTVRYIDEAGKKLSDDIILSGNVDDPYMSEAREFTDYTLTTTPANASGSFTDKSQTVTYVYTKNETTPVATGTVITKYVDENGTPIASDNELTGNYGDSYTTEQKDVEGYTFKEVATGTNNAPATGSYNNGTQIVTYIYKKDKVTPTPENPETPNKPDEPETPGKPDNNEPSNKPETSSSNGSTNQFNESTNVSKNANGKVENTLPQAGSENNILTIILGMITSVLAVLGISFKKKNN